MIHKLLFITSPVIYARLYTWATVKEIEEPTQPRQSLEEIRNLAIQTGLEPSELYNVRGVTLANYGKLTEAKEVFIQALELNPQNECARKSLAQLPGEGRAIPLPFEIHTEL